LHPKTPVANLHQRPPFCLIIGSFFVKKNIGEFCDIYEVWPPARASRKGRSDKTAHGCAFGKHREKIRMRFELLEPILAIGT